MSVIVLALSMLMLMRVVVIMAMFVRMFMTFMVVMAGIGVVMFGIVRVAMTVVGVQALVIGALIRLRGGRGVGAGVVDHLALDPLAIAAAAQLRVARLGLRRWRASASSSPSRCARSSSPICPCRSATGIW